MTNWNQFVTFPPATPAGRPIEPDFTLASPPDGRTFRRRRLGLLTGILAATLAIGGAVADGERTGTAVVAAGASSTPGPGHHGVDEAGAVVATGSGSAVTLADVFAETTSTLLAVTTTSVAETTSTHAPTSTSSVAPTTSAAAAETAAPSTSTSATPTTTAPPTTAAPTTTAAPKSSPSTTAAPSSSSDYGDPNTLQVWLDLADCESNGNWSINTGNGYYGGLQFSLPTWESVGGTGYPHEHPRDTQIEMGRRLQASQGWGAWPHCSEKLGLR